MVLAVQAIYSIAKLRWNTMMQPGNGRWMRSPAPCSGCRARPGDAAGSCPQEGATPHGALNAVVLAGHSALAHRVDVMETIKHRFHAPWNKAPNGLDGRF